VGQWIAAFPTRDEFEKARAAFERRQASFTVISPDPGYRLVGVPALVADDEARQAVMVHDGTALTPAGWVEYRPATIVPPAEEPPSFAEDLLGEAAMMVLAPCVADPTKIRLIAHTRGDLSAALPYMNAVMREASYNARGPTFTFMDRYRMISLYPRRIAVAKADDIVDGWRTLEMIRRRVNETWARRAEITPSDEMRAKPPALEIFKRLPQTNCRACGEATCLAFAVRVWNGSGSPEACKPVFAGEYGHLRAALREICTGLGVATVDRVGD
jgi:ArsR family metal-binding transcriptional regulator